MGYCFFNFSNPKLLFLGQECESIQPRNENSITIPDVNGGGNYHQESQPQDVGDGFYHHTSQDNNYSLQTVRVVGSFPLLEPFNLNDSSSLNNSNLCFNPVNNVFEDILSLPVILSDSVLPVEPGSESVGHTVLNNSFNLISEELSQSTNVHAVNKENENVGENLATILKEVRHNISDDHDEEPIHHLNDVELVDNQEENGDFLDNNYEPSSESDLEESYDGANHSKELSQKRKRAKRGRAEKSQWTATKNKIKRMKGEEYEGRRKSEKGKTVFDVKRPKRSIKPRCSCDGKQKHKFKCTQITDERRQQIFKNFWALDWNQRKVEVHHLVDLKDVQQKTVSGTKSRRSASLFYHLKPQNNLERVRVCKAMFLNSLCVGEWMIRNWVLQNKKHRQDDKNVNNDAHEQDDEDVETENTAPTRKEKCSSNERKLVTDFFNNLPKLESHYCRKDTNKLYLEPQWQSKAQLFREYQLYSKSEGKEHLVASSFTFHEVFEAHNLGLFSPKKDQCDLCCGYQQGNVSEPEHVAHITRKNAAREEKTKDKEETDERTAVFTMDVQAVLLCPFLKASALYYRRKLKVHNFTFYNLKSCEGYCYLWDECEGGVNADEFATIVTHFISKEINLDIVKHVILYSDGCTSQNRNAIMANALLLASHKTGVTITQKYLEKGHTQMECDSIHSNIEKKMRNREIYSPAGYFEVCKTARIKPQPYKVEQLDHTFFKRYNDLKLLTSIRPGTKKGDPLVTDLRCIQYKPDCTIQVKLNHQDQYLDLPRRNKGNKKPSDCSVERPPLFNSRLPIDLVKFNHLQELKFVIPKDIHYFYDNLPHQ